MAICIKLRERGKRVPLLEAEAQFSFNLAPCTLPVYELYYFCLILLSVHLPTLAVY